jgi:hypothetical protein
MKNKLMETEIKICSCDGAAQHEQFTKSEYTFPDGSTELLPDLCPENEYLPSGLFQHYEPILKTLESNENWTMFSCYSGMIAEISPGLYFYSFGDIDEAGESNFYIKSELNVVVEKLLAEWGELAPPWREFLKSVGNSGYPKGYEPGSMVHHKVLFPKLDEEGLSVGFSFNMENQSLINALKEL